MLKDLRSLFPKHFPGSLPYSWVFCVLDILHSFKLNHLMTINEYNFLYFLFFYVIFIFCCWYFRCFILFYFSTKKTNKNTSEKKHMNTAGEIQRNYIYMIINKYSFLYFLLLFSKFSRVNPRPLTTKIVHWWEEMWRISSVASCIWLGSNLIGEYIYSIQYTHRLYY